MVIEQVPQQMGCLFIKCFGWFSFNDGLPLYFVIPEGGLGYVHCSWASLIIYLAFGMDGVPTIVFNGT
jgi:hypothetical protein